MSDAFDDAMKAEARSANIYFGEITTDAWHCVLEKGQGKVPFDADIHPPDQKMTALTIALTPYTRTGVAQYIIKREMIAESSEWTRIVRPSLEACKTDLRSINNKWAQIEIVPTGRKYKNQHGQEKDATTIKFLAVFDTAEGCREAMAQYFQHGNGDSDTSGAIPPPSNGNGSSNGAGKPTANRETALKFVAPLWAASNGDLQTFEQKLKANPATAILNITDDDVIAIITPKAATAS